MLVIIRLKDKNEDGRHQIETISASSTPTYVRDGFYMVHDHGGSIHRFPAGQPGDV